MFQTRLMASIMVGVLTTPVFADVVFTDSTFAPSDYSQTPNFHINDATLSGSQCVSCGNPATGLQFEAVFGPFGGQAALGFINNTFSYDPIIQGSIVSIKISVDKNLTTDVNGPLGNTFRPLIEQNGNFYVAFVPGPALSGPGSTGFLTFMQSDLLPTDFQQYDFNVGQFVLGNPNFGIGPMLFGVAQFSFLDFGASGTITVAYDNLSIDIATAVAEPSTLFLLAIGAINLLGRRRPRN